MFDFIKYVDENQLIPNLVGLKYTGMYGTPMSFADIMNILGHKNGNMKCLEVETKWFCSCYVLVSKDLLV